MKKVLAVILSVIMMFSMLPMCFAEYTKPEEAGSTIWDATVDAVKPIIDAIKGIFDFIKSIFNQIKSFFEDISFNISMSQRTDDPQPIEMPQGYVDRVNGFIEQNKTAAPGQTVLVGDSITHLLDVDKCFADYMNTTGTVVYNRGIAGDVTPNCLQRFRVSVTEIKPKNIVIEIGANDIAHCDASPKGVVKNIQKMLDIIKEDLGTNVNVIVSCLYPTSKINDGKLVPDKSRPTKVIDMTNDLIRDLAKTNDITILDLTSKLKDKDGLFNIDYTLDGLHPNPRCYDEIVVPAIIELLK